MATDFKRGPCLFKCEHRGKDGYCKLIRCANPKYEYSVTIMTKHNTIPPGCIHCFNHPSNGGSGFCNCTVGCQTIY